MTSDIKLVRIDPETYARLRKYLIKVNGDIVYGDILKYATEAIEYYISENLPEGEEL